MRALPWLAGWLIIGIIVLVIISAYTKETAKRFKVEHSIGGDATIILGWPLGLLAAVIAGIGYALWRAWRLVRPAKRRTAK